MATDLERARQQFAEGRHKKAIDTLWTAAAYPESVAEAKAIVQCASELRDQTDGRLRKLADELLEYAQTKLAAAEQPKPQPSRFRQGIPVSTSNDVPGWEITGYLGEIFGVVVRSRGAFPQFGANLKSVFGGELGTMTNLLRQTRQVAIDRLVEEAEARGADAVIAMRFDVTTMGDTSGWTEICAYGTAVRATRLSDAARPDTPPSLQ
jgi:uncharacterized protein YbjQ (UPF0145 family)